MYKATRDFIKARQQHSEYVVEKVSVKQVGGGNANDCFNNACDTIDRSKGIKHTSGWIVGKFNKFKNSTEIIQHFWNVDKDGSHFDTTPLIGSEVEYVIDCEINTHGQQNYDEVDSCVASSLLLKDGKFVAVDPQKKMGDLFFVILIRYLLITCSKRLLKKMKLMKETVYGKHTISIAEYMNLFMSQNSTFIIAA